MMAYKKSPMICFLYNSPVDTLTLCCCFGPAMLFPLQGFCTCYCLWLKCSYPIPHPLPNIPLAITPLHLGLCSYVFSFPSTTPSKITPTLSSIPLIYFSSSSFLQGYAFYSFYLLLLSPFFFFHEDCNFISFINASLALTTVSGT